MTDSSLSLFRKINFITSESNRYLLDTMIALAHTFESGNYVQDDLKTLIEEIKEKHDSFVDQITDPMRKINFIAGYQKLNNMIL